MALSQKRKLACKAFLILWGGWTAAAILVALILPRFLFNASETAGGIVALFLTGIALAAWEKHFRRKRLCLVAQRPWHAWLVLVPLFVAGLGWMYAHVLCKHIPGGLRNSVTFTYSGPANEEGERDLLFHVDMEISNAPAADTMLPQRTIIHASPQWVIDSRNGRVFSDGETFQLNRNAFRNLARRLVPEANEAHQEDLANVLGPHLIKGVLPIRGSTAFEIAVVEVTTGTVSIPWVSAVVALFSLMLLPVTWFVVRFTMFPEGIPLPEEDP